MNKVELIIKKRIEVWFLFFNYTNNLNNLKFLNGPTR